MRRAMISMSQGKLGQSLGVSFQQIQKYEKGTNRISASALQHLSDVLGVPISFFFEGAPNSPEVRLADKDGLSPSFITDFLATVEGLALSRAFVCIKDKKVRRALVDAVEEIADDLER